MKKRAVTIRLQGEVESRSDADRKLLQPGDCVVVRRGVLRSVVMACPDGCGDVMTINLDGRSGPAWRLYQDKALVSLYPSIWRHTGCKSHFIVWRNQVVWCDYDYGDEPTYAEQSELEPRVMALLNEDAFVSYVRIAEKLQEVPWEIQRVCNRLVKNGLAERGAKDTANAYRRVSKRVGVNKLW